MSNRDRIERMAQEAEAAKKEKAEAAKKKPAAPKARSTKKKAATRPTGRTKVVWLVCDQAGRAVKTYPYPEEADARTESQRLTEETGKTHFVRRDEVPFE